MPLSPKIDPPEISRQKPLLDSGIWNLNWQKWFTQAYRAFLFLLAGTQQLTQADIAQFATSLDGDDQGIQIGITDYNHLLQWTGTGWQFAPGDAGSGYLVQFLFTPGAGWHVADGSSVNYLQGDGTLGSVAVPAMPGFWFRQ